MYIGIFTKEIPKFKETIETKKASFALEARNNTIKARKGRVFKPFNITIKKGETLIIDK